jgi:hypothetical protein
MMKSRKSGYQPNCSQCNSILGPLTLTAFVAVRLTVHINDSGPQAAIAILSLSLAVDTRLLINVSTSGRPGSTPCNVKSHSCVRLVRESVCFSRSCGKWSNLELEADKGEWEVAGWITCCFSSPIGVLVAISNLSSEIIGDIAGEIRDGGLWSKFGRVE